MGEKFNAPDPGAMQSSATGEAGQKNWLPANFKTAPGEGAGPPADDPGAEPDAASRNFEKFKNDSPAADAKSVDSYMKMENAKAADSYIETNAKATDSYMKMENAKSDPGAGPDAASSKAGYDVKKQDRI